MDVRDFVKKQEAALKRYRRMYKLLDFIGTTLILYLLLFYFHVDEVFPMLSSFEVKAGTSYDILGMSIAFETVALTLIAAFVSLIITFFRHLRDTRTKAITLIEEQHLELRERLRTAYDNANVDNLIVSDLVNSVSASLTAVTSSELLKKGKLVFGLIIILVSSTTIVYVVENDIRTGAVDPEDLGDLINDILTGDEEDTSGGLYEIAETTDDDDSSSGTEDLTGETAIIVVEGTEVDLTLPPGTGVGFQPEGEAEEADEEFEQSSPYEISIISSQSYDEELPEGYESVIKSYFEEMAKN